MDQKKVYKKILKAYDTLEEQFDCDKYIWLLGVEIIKSLEGITDEEVKNLFSFNYLTNKLQLLGIDVYLLKDDEKYAIKLYKKHYSNDNLLGMTDIELESFIERLVKDSPKPSLYRCPKCLDVTPIYFDTLMPPKCLRCGARLDKEVDLWSEKCEN